MRDDRGLALPLVLIVMLVLSLLGTAVWQYSVTDNIQVAREEKRMQAYYLARSGADAVAEYLTKNPSQVASIIARTGKNNMAAGSLGSGRDFQVNVSGDIVNGIIVTGVGTSGDVSRTVHLNLTSLKASEVFENVIYTFGDLDISQLKTIVGDVASAGNIIKGSNYSYTATPFHEANYPSPIIPEGLPSAGSISVGNKQTVTIASDAWYSGITMSPNGTLVFDVQDRVMQVVVHDMETKGNVVVQVSGKGRLELYITNKAEFHTPMVVNSGDPNSVFIFLKDGTYLNMQANGTTNAYIYGPNAIVAIQSAHSTVRGAIISNLFVRKHNNNQPSIGNVVFHPVSADTDSLSAIVSLKRGAWRD